MDDGYPFPTIKDVITDMRNSKYFSQLDMEKGYYQIKVSKKDIHKTAFTLPFGLYEFQRMPFGLKNAPRVFQRIIQKILNGLDFVKIYLDDILIHSKTMEDHEHHIKIVLNKLKEANVKINFDKSSFLVEEVKYLVLIISKKGIKADISKIEKIQQLEVPKSKKQLQKLLGFINWFRDFLPNISTKIEPLTNKLKKRNNENFHWDKKDEKIRQDVFKLIINHSLLTHPDFSKDFKIY